MLRARARERSYYLHFIAAPTTKSCFWEKKAIKGFYFLLESTSQTKSNKQAPVDANELRHRLNIFWFCLIRIYFCALDFFFCILFFSFTLLYVEYTKRVPFFFQFLFCYVLCTHTAVIWAWIRWLIVLRLCSVE